MVSNLMANPDALFLAGTVGISGVWVVDTVLTMLFRNRPRIAGAITRLSILLTMGYFAIVLYWLWATLEILL